MTAPGVGLHRDFLDQLKTLQGTGAVLGAIAAEYPKSLSTEKIKRR